MSLFDGLFGESIESRLRRLEPQIDEECDAFHDYIDEMIDEENDTLSSLGIPLPTLIWHLSYTIKISTTHNDEKKLLVNLITPRFQFPPRRMFVVKPNSLIATLFKDLDTAERAYWQWGLGHTVQTKYGTVWTNRDPFALYRLLQAKGPDGFLYEKPGDFITRAMSYEPDFRDVFSDTLNEKDIQLTNNLISKFPRKAKNVLVLKAVKELSPAEAARVHLRAQLYNYVTDGQYENLRAESDFYNLIDPGTEVLSDDGLFDLPVPSIIVESDHAYIKILPSGAIKPARMIEFFNSLRGAVKSFVSFELLREGETVCFRLQLSKKAKDPVINLLELFFPDFQCIEVPAPNEPQNFFIDSLKKHSLYASIRRLRDFQLDPYAHLASFFDKADLGDGLCYQVIFAKLSDEAASNLKWYLSRYPFEDSNIAANFAKKLPLWFVSINVSSKHEDVNRMLIESVSKGFDTPEGNFCDPYLHTINSQPFPIRNPTFISLYDTEELAALAHFPITELPIERLEKTSMKNVQPPEIYTGGAVRVGEAKARGKAVPVTLPETVRDRHVYVVGKSGTGKSTLVENIARHDIEAGRGIAVIDPHGDLVHHLLEIIPEHRVNDCVLFSPKHFPVSLEILSAENEHEIDLLSDDLITMFRRTSESWGDRMQAILQMTFQTLLRVPGSSFTDITLLLTDESYCNRILTKINHPQLVSFWQQRYDMRQAEPILIRMDRLTTSGTLHAVLTQNKNSLNFYDVITESKIFLADLSKGFLGESTSHLLGSIIVSQIQLAAMRQAHLPMEQRIPFSLFVDEVQNFTTSAFSTILSEARKQKLRLTIAHQFVSQLPGDLQKAVFGNVGTLFFFALSPDDLGAARHELGTFEPVDVANLPKYHALCRPATAARDTFSFATEPPPPLPATNFTKQIIEQTRQQYGAQVARTSETQSSSPASDTKPQKNQVPQQSEQKVSPPPIRRRPADALPLFFPTNTEKIMHYMRQAEYLSQPQIIALTELLPPNASTALKKLVETGQIKSLDDRRPKIYFIGRTCNPTVHNLLVRDLFVKISASGYAVRSVKFNDVLPDLNPDLTIEFMSKEENMLTPLPAYFELDRGTEGVQELVKKADRYARINPLPRVCFVFERESDMELARTRIDHPFILYAVLDRFVSLKDAAFSAQGAPAAQLPFFGS